MAARKIVRRSCLGARPRYNLVVDEDVKKPNKQKKATHETELGDMASVSAGHIILTPTQPEGSGRPQRESNLGPPHQESRALPTELPEMVSAPSTP